jgi:hypothetical protein
MHASMRAERSKQHGVGRNGGVTLKSTGTALGSNMGERKAVGKRQDAVVQGQT